VQLLDGPWCAASGAHVTKIIDVVTHSDEQVEEQLSPHLQFHLHGTTTLERFPATDDQSQVMSAQFAVTVRGVLIGIPSTAQNRSDLDSALQTLLAQGELLELFEAVTVSCTVNGCVTEKDIAHAGVKKRGFDSHCAIALVGVG